MTSARARELLVGHALAAGEPIGPILRGAGKEGRVGQIAAAEAADAGDLTRALRLAGFPADLVAVAVAWPAAVRPAQRRLTRIPTSLVFHAPLVQTLSWFVGILCIQCAVLAILRLKVAPVFADISSSRAAFDWLYAGEIAFLVLGLPFFIAVLSGWAGRLGFVSWGRHLASARQAALAGALLESGAPSPLGLAPYPLGASPGSASLAELDGVLLFSLAQAEAAHQRFVAATRFFGFGVLTLLALGATAEVYQAVALLSTSVSE